MKSIMKASLQLVTPMVEEKQTVPAGSSIQELRVGERGFSIFELSIAALILLTLSAITIFTFANTKIEKTDEQALALINILQDARLRALTSRRTIRVSIDDTKKSVYLIEERDPLTANDDVVLKTMRISSAVAIGTVPTAVKAPPTASFPAPVQQFAQTQYRLTQNDKVITLRFLSDGRVVDRGTEPLGANALITGATIYISNIKPTPKTPTIVRALMVSGNSAHSFINKCVVNGSDKCVSWTRR
ncbi:MAG: hypothetical protein ACK5NT_03940 [Pyrinomonadaceae bacterium]